MVLTPELIGQAIVVLFVAINGIHSVRTDRKRVRIEDAKQNRAEEVNRKIDRLYAFVVGPDGRGGVRRDVEDLKERVDDLDDWVRNRLHGPYNPHVTPPPHGG